MTASATLLPLKHPQLKDEHRCHHVTIVCLCCHYCPPGHSLRLASCHYDAATVTLRGQHRALLVRLVCSESHNPIKCIVVFICAGQGKLMYRGSLLSPACVESCAVDMCPSSTQATHSSLPKALLTQSTSSLIEGWAWMEYTKKTHTQPNPWSADARQCEWILPFILVLVLFLVKQCSNILSS
jgi:hypothetical protein